MKESEAVRHLMSRLDELATIPIFVPSATDPEHRPMNKDRNAITVATRLHERLLHEEVMAELSAELIETVNQMRRERRERHEQWRAVY